MIVSGNLVHEIDTFCSSKLSPTISVIKGTKKNALFHLKKQEKHSTSSSFRPVWNGSQYTKSLYNLLPKPSHVNEETFLLHFRKEQDTIGYPRMHEISEWSGVDGVVQIMGLNYPFPGKRPHLLFEGYFVPCEGDARNAMLVSLMSEYQFEFASENIAKRMLERHGNSVKPGIFRIEKDSEGVWLMKGVHPLVPTTDPKPRLFSLNHQRLKGERTPEADSALQTRIMAPDGMELLHKASRSSSTLTSPSRKAEVGVVSLKVSFVIDEEDDLHKEIIKEMQVNALVMNKMRYLQYTAVLLEHVISRMHVSLSKCPDINNLILKSRFTNDYTLEVSLLLNLIFIHSRRSPSLTLPMGIQYLHSLPVRQRKTRLIVSLRSWTKSLRCLILIFPLPSLP